MPVAFPSDRLEALDSDDGEMHLLSNVLAPCASPRNSWPGAVARVETAQGTCRPA